MKNKFGQTRLLRDDISYLHKLFFKLAGVSPDHKLRFMYLRKFLRNEIDRETIKYILDAGCGGGDYSFYLARCFPDSNVLAIDIAEDTITKNKNLLKKTKIKNLKFKKQDVIALNNIEEFDFICCIDVLEHVKDQRKALECLYKALKYGGSLFIHMPLSRSKRVIFDKYLVDFHDWAEKEHIAPPQTRESVLDMLKESGFKVVQAQNSFNHYLGEFAVSIIMLFYKNTVFNKIILALLTAMMSFLIYLDIAIENKSGNAIAVLLRKEELNKCSSERNLLHNHQQNIE